MSIRKVESVVSSKLTAALAATLMLCPFVTEACSWPDGYRLTEAAIVDRFCDADAVFVGEVESSLNVNERITETKIWPREILKGQVSSPVYVLNYRFKPLGKYLVFADRYEDTEYLFVSTCDLSQSFSADSFTYRVIMSTTNVAVECGEEATRRRKAEHRDEWIRKYAVEEAKMKEIYELTRQQQEANEATDSEQ